MSEYLKGWADAARVCDGLKRDIASGIYGPTSPRGLVLDHTRDGITRDGDRGRGFADGALAAFGHGDTDGARVGERQ